jgi:hypothetical protein
MTLKPYLIVITVVIAASSILFLKPSNALNLPVLISQKSDVTVLSQRQIDTISKILTKDQPMEFKKKISEGQDYRQVLESFQLTEQQKKEIQLSLLEQTP